MAGNPRTGDAGKSLLQDTGKRYQAGVLGLGKRLVIGAFQLDTEGEIVAVFAAIEA